MLRNSIRYHQEMARIHHRITERPLTTIAEVLEADRLAGLNGLNETIERRPVERTAVRAHSSSPLSKLIGKLKQRTAHLRGETL